MFIIGGHSFYRVTCLLKSGEVSSVATNLCGLLQISRVTELESNTLQVPVNSEQRTGEEVYHFIIFSDVRVIIELFHSNNEQ
jgi:hypothetical protein